MRGDLDTSFLVKIYVFLCRFKRARDEIL